ncbi:MAG: hypothetical protein R3F27_09025 [Gammaproteobacteria bacterium]
MRWLIGILGLVLGLLAGTAIVLFNPLAAGSQQGPVQANLVPDKAYRMDDYRGMDPGLGSLLRGAGRSGEKALAAPALAKLRIGIVVLPAGNGRPAALAVKVSTLSEKNSLWRAQLGTLDYWNIFWPGEGSVFASGYSNYWPLLQDGFLDMLPGTDAAADPVVPLSAQPPAGELAGVNGAAGRYAGFIGEIRESLLVAASGEPGWQLSLKASPPPLGSQ